MLTLIYLAIALGGIAAIAYPLFFASARKRWAFLKDDDHRTKLLAEKEAVYSAIKELDFDYQTGKLSEEDYKELRENYRTRAFLVLKKLDEEEAGEGLENLIEEEILALRQRRTKVQEEASIENRVQICTQCGQQADFEDNFCASCGSPLAFACASCGNPYQPEERFCSACGKELPNRDRD